MDQKTQVAIRAEGAELYVRAHLMLEQGIPISMASSNMPGYDLIAHNATTERSCRIQVKYRSAVNSDGACVKNFDFDFMVYVAGNIGRIGSKVPLRQAQHKAMEVFVIPVEVVQQNVRAYDLFPSPTRGGCEAYRNAWHLIEQFLMMDQTT